MKRYLFSRCNRHVLVLHALFLFTTTNVVGQSSEGEIKLNGTPIVNLNAKPLNEPGFKILPKKVTQQANVPVQPAVQGKFKIDAASPAKDSTLCTIWFEYGDGGFTTLPITTRAMGTENTPEPFFMLNPLYDTTRGKDGTFIRSMQPTVPTVTRQARSSANDMSLLADRPGIALTASANRLVPKEPMAVAITYRLPNDIVAGSKYYVVLYYNNNSFFQPVAKTSKTKYLYSKYDVNDVRLSDGQGFTNTLPTFIINKEANYTDSLVIDISPNFTGERNFFVTLKTLANAPIGESSSIQAVLVQHDSLKGSSVIYSSSLSNMRVEGAFDPNNLSQSPSCLLLPKQQTPLTFHINFQNLGKGPADSVKVLFKRPKHLLDNSFTLKSAKFANTNINTSLDRTDPNIYFHHGFDPVNYVDTFIFASQSGKGITLKGTEEVSNPLVNPLTMGEVTFAITTSANTDDSIKSSAGIYFHSLHALQLYGKDKWEDSVNTNNALSVYKKKACECDNTCVSCYTILGLCWWWYILILLFIIILLRLILRRRS